MAAGDSARTWIAIAAIVGLALRLAFALFYWVGQPLTRDEVEYLSLARSLVAGRGYVYDDEVLKGPVQPFGRAPGYPVFLALTGGGGASVTTTVPSSVKIAQSIVGAVGVFMIAAVARRIAGTRAAVAAAWIAACYPPLVWLPAYALSEAIFWPLGLGLAWTFDRFAFANTRIRTIAVLAGVLAGIAVLTRAATSLFLPLAGMWLLARRKVSVVGLFALGVAVVLVPWATRSTLHHGQFVPVASDGGVTFWTGNNALATGEGDMAANPELKIANQQLRAQHPNLSEEQMEPVYYREALGWIRAHPLDWVTLEFKKFFYLVVPIGPSYRLHSSRYLIASLVSYGPLLVAAILGFLRLGTRRRLAPGLWLMLAAAVGVALVFFPQERFRLPVIDPVLVVCAAALAMRPSDVAS